MPRPILYDLTSNDGNICWSPYTWKVRLCLNYKGIAYETKFLDYPDVKPTLSSLGISPGDPSKGHGAAFTIPALTLDDGATHIMESLAISRALDAAYPDTPRLWGPAADDDGDRARVAMFSKADALVHDFDVALYPNFMAAIERRLPPRSAEYFARTRSEAFGGVTMDELEARDGGDGPWVKAEPAMKGMAKALVRESDGPFLLGKEVSYGDFVIVAFWHFLRRVDERLFERLMRYHDAFPRLYKACQPWILKKQS